MTGYYDNGYVGIFLSKAIFGESKVHKVTAVLQRSFISDADLSNNMEEIDNFLVLPSTNLLLLFILLTKVVSCMSWGLLTSVHRKIRNLFVDIKSNGLLLFYFWAEPTFCCLCNLGVYFDFRRKRFL